MSHSTPAHRFGESPFRIAAIYAAQPNMDYLESSVRSIHDSAELVLLGVKESDRPLQNTVSTIPELAGKIEITYGDWDSTDKCIVSLARNLAARGFSHVLLMDPQDVYSNEDLPRILSFAQEHPGAGQFQVRVRTYWKSPHYRIEPDDSVTRTVLFRISAATNLPVLLIPEDVGVCHSFSLASSTAIVVQRLKESGIGEATLAQWKRNVWDDWDLKKALRNLHPTQPSLLRGATRVQLCSLPESLAHHAYLAYEVVGEESAKAPVCSLVFVARREGERGIASLVRRLAATVPDDCDVVGCASGEDTLAVLQSMPGVKAVRIPTTHSLHDAWIAGSAAAESSRLVFLTSELEFAGDWIEGFIAAFERNQRQLIYLPLVLGSTPRADERTAALLFERYRGRHYGQQSPVDERFNPETAACWGCTRETLQSAEAGEIECVSLDDTVVFQAAPSEDVAKRTVSAVASATPAPVAALRATIVIPVFNNLSLTRNCLESVFRHTTSGMYEVVVVDNGSTDGSWEYLQGLRPRIRCIRNRRNLFFAKGCNRGGWASVAKHIVFLNNDTLVKPGWLDELLRPLDNDGTVGIAGNKQLFPGSHPVCANRVWHAGTVVGADRLPWHVCYGFDPTHPAVNKERDCVSVSGCCLAIRRSLFEQLGGFDPHFQNGFEDADLCLRARTLNYRTVYAPRSEIVHLVSSSESRFDRDASNLEKFNARWADKIIPDEGEFLRDSGLLPRSPSGTGIRVGFLSSFNQQGALARNAARLLDQYPSDSYVVLSEFGIRDRNPEPDALNVVRCWDRTGTWYYPLLRWATTLDLQVIHVNFHPSLFPHGFLELLLALKKAGKPLVFTIHEKQEHTALLAGIAQLADAIIVETESLCLRLIDDGFPAWKLHLIAPLAAEMHWNLYTDVVSRPSRTLPRIRWEGPQLVNHSLALVNREMEMALLQSGKAELTIAPIGEDTFTGSLNPRTRMLPTHYGGALTGPADVHVRHQWPPHWEPPAQGRWVVIQPWEYGGVPEEWVKQINLHVDEVWAPSNFVRGLYVESGADPSRIRVVPNGVDPDLFKPGVKAYPLKSSKSFRFLFLGGTIYRKGIDILLDAYCGAFNVGDDVSLVIKDTGVNDIYRGQGMGERILEMQSRPDSPEILYLNRDFTDTEMAQLYNACHCLVHPYRGEGFALPVLEAMACALPVIVTAGGPTDDFVDDNTGFRIPAIKQVFGNRSISGLKTAGDLWMLAPDVDALTTKLSEVFHDRESAREMGGRARKKVEDGWTWKHAASKAMDRIEALRALPVVRHLRQVDAAVLLDLPEEWALAAVIESIKRTSYATLAIFVRAAKRTAVLQDLCQAHPDIEILDEGDFSAVLGRLRMDVRAPFLALVTEPRRFSKNWLKQLADVGRAAGEDLSVVVPWTEVQGAVGIDDKEFQRLARVHWRNHRGVYRKLADLPAGCALMSWGCLWLAVPEPVHDSRHWMAQLHSSGIRTYLAEDTCLGSLQSDSPLAKDVLSLR